MFDNMDIPDQNININQDVPQLSLDELYQSMYQVPGVSFHTFENLPTDKVTGLGFGTTNLLFPNFSLFPYNPYNNFTELSAMTNLETNLETNLDSGFSYEGIPVSNQPSLSSTSHYSSGSETLNLNTRPNLASCSPQGALGLPTINEALSCSQMAFNEEDCMDLVEKYFNLDPELPSEFGSKNTSVSSELVSKNNSLPSEFGSKNTSVSSELVSKNTSLPSEFGSKNTSLPSEFTPQTTSLPFNPVETTANPKVPIKRLKPRGKKDLKARDKKTKTSHMEIEQKYRNSLIFGINELRNELPFAPRPEGKGLVALGDIEPPSKLNKSTVLRKATEYIKELKRNNSRLEQQNSRFKEALRLLPGGLEMLSDIESEATSSSPNTAESFSSSPASRFLMASFLLVTFWNAPSSVPSSVYPTGPIGPGQSKVSSLSSFPLIIFATFLCLFALVTSNSLQTFLFGSKPKKPTNYNLASELECLDKKNPSNSIVTFFKQLYFLTQVFVQKFLPFFNHQTNQSATPSNLLLNLTLLNYASAKDSPGWSSSIETLFFKLSFVLIVVRSILVCNSKSRPDLLLSLSLTTLSLLPGSVLGIRVSQYLLSEAGKLSGHTLLASPIFLEWLAGFPTIQSDSVSVSTEPETISLVVWVLGKFHAYHIDQLAKAYLTNPNQTPSLQPVLDWITFDKLTLVHQPSLILALQLEATFAFSNGHTRYAEALTLKLAQQFSHNPNYFTPKSKAILQGLIGCLLSIEGPHRDIQTASFLLDNYLSKTNPSKFSSSIEFLVSHLFLTVSLTLCDLNLLERNDLTHKLDKTDDASNQKLHPASLSKYVHDLRLNLYKIPLARLKCPDSEDLSKTDSRHMLAVHYQSVAKWLASSDQSLSLNFNTRVV